MPKRTLAQSRLTLGVPGIAWYRLPLVMLPVAGGLGLAMHILTRVSLPLAYGALALGGVVAWWLLLRRAEAASRVRLLRRVRVGFLSGLVATLLYDASRYGVVALLSFSVEPFAAWSLFGQAIVGSQASKSAALAIGTAFHTVNGLGFGVAFTLLVRQPTWWSGVLWGLGLELVMALLYPSWLRIAQLQEFMTMSVLGHLVYGATLGAVAAAALAKQAAGGPSTVRSSVADGR